MTHPAAQDPWFELARSEVPGAIAVISGIEGPAYRNVGTAMAILPDGRRFGALSSGCIEEDVVDHALAALADGQVRKLRYGAGSPFFDLKLPCGGALEIMVIPTPDRALLIELEVRRARREETTLGVSAAGALRFMQQDEVPDEMAELHIAFPPEPRFVIFGAGAEAVFFADLVRATGAPHLLLTPEDATFANAEGAGCTVRKLDRSAIPADVVIDARSAVILLFHDHDWELEILEVALATPAFYIGAQGSMLTQNRRRQGLQARGVEEAMCARVRGPIGVIQSARDPRLLAVSVLAEVLAEVQRGVSAPSRLAQRSGR
ncbi:XdhC family protein [Thioclava atlantica]|uniref:Exported xanthine dehydrogenase/CoxI family protein n=1 Tax=Thioclava atlantica TaxID=1317124 RepID=A0A085U0N6_9RHOB|nr:exported xanthine dehydrogenase/CoxI family protein [Thioclava atlantica]